MTVVPSPLPGDTYAIYLARRGLLGRGFAFPEIVRDGSHRHVEPPRELWARMVPTLELAIELRARMLAAGARGLRIAAAYRPLGGAADSQHKHNAALDLDLLPGDESFGYALALRAADLWREHEDLRTGVGTYAPAGALWTRRAHLDTGYRFRCWQGLPGGGWSDLPAALVLAPPDPTDFDGRAYVAGYQLDADCVRQGARFPIGAS